MLVLLFLFCFCLACKPLLREQYNLCLGIIVLCSLCIKIWACSDPWLHGWDERYHALVAKNLLHHFLKPTLYETPFLSYDYKNWTCNHIWLHKQPLTLWLIALSLKTFGYSAFAVRVPSIILSSVSIVLIYKIGKEWFDEKVGIVAAFLLSVNGLILTLVSGNDNTDHVDIAFFTIVLFSVWLIVVAIRKKSIVYHMFAGVVVGFAVLTKWLPALVVIPIWFLLAKNVYKPDKHKAAIHLLTLVLCALIVAAPWQFFILHQYPQEANWEFSYNRLHLTKALEGHDGNWFYHFNFLKIIYGETVYIPILWFLYQAAKYRRLEFTVLSAWFLLPYMFFSFSATKMPANTLLSAPAIFLMTAVFFWRSVALIQQRQHHK